MKELEIKQKLNRLAKESENELKEMGFVSQLNEVGNIYYYISSATSCFGQCINKEKISISRWLLEYGSDNDIKNTIIHELLHTFKDTKGHGTKWQMYARLVNNYGKYHITRTDSIEKIMSNNGVDINKQIDILGYRYEITCLKCGCKWYRTKLLDKVVNGCRVGNRIHRNCGGCSFKVVDLKTNKILVNGIE